MDNVWSYGGAMAALTCTLLLHIMNADPQVVHYVHNSGLAKSFLRMIKGTTIKGKAWFEPNFPPSPDLIMALPNVISALSLTEDGAKRIRDSNPIRELLGILCGRKYVMPQMRCLLNEMPIFIGQGLDDFMRHVPEGGIVSDPSAVWDRAEDSVPPEVSDVIAVRCCRRWWLPVL